MPQETYGGSQQYYCGQPGTINACPLLVAIAVMAL